MTKIKVCGLRRPCDIEWANECLPDYIGFVFAKSRRQVSAEQAAKLRELLDERILPVGVFVNAAEDEILRLLDLGVISIAQLHGQESDEEIRRIQRLSGRPVIKAFSIASKEDIKKACASPADYLLLDCGAGGTGKTFDWELLGDSDGMGGRPFFLAGGIRTENIRQAVTGIRPYAVDVSSGAETDGYKDKNKMFELVRRVRNV